MYAIGNTSSSTASSGASGTKSSGQMVEAQDRFLKLLVTQMQNQDPLNPVDNAQVTSQMAQISTVQGIEQLNAAMSDFSAMFGALQSVQAVSMIGHGALVEGKNLMLGSQGAVGGMELESAANKVILTIRDAGGNVVSEQNLGAQDAGVLNFTWDGETTAGGQAPAGAYTFSVAASYNGQDVGAKALQFGMVDSVSFASGKSQVNIHGVGSVDLEAIRQVI